MATRAQRHDDGDQGKVNDVERLATRHFARAEP